MDSLFVSERRIHRAQSGANRKKYPSDVLRRSRSSDLLKIKTISVPIAQTLPDLLDPLSRNSFSMLSVLQGLHNEPNSLQGCSYGELLGSNKISWVGGEVAAMGEIVSDNFEGFLGLAEESVMRGGGGLVHGEGE